MESKGIFTLYFIYTLKIFIRYLLFSTTSRKLFQKIHQKETHYH